MHMFSRVAILGVTVIGLSMAGCARDMTVGSAIESEGAGLASIGADWTRGDDLVADGKADVEKGKSMMKKGRSLVDKGEAKISKGQALRSAAERTYRKRTGKDLPDLETE